MSISSSVTGIKPPDEKWKKMKAAFDACKEADIPVPNEVWNFFNHDIPDEHGVVIHEEDLGDAVERIGCEYGIANFVVHLDKLPPDVKILKFDNR